MKNKEKKEVEKQAECKDSRCPVHGSLSTRGRIFEGTITRKFPKRITIEFERTVYIKKYERYMRKKTRIHAWLPECLQNSVEIGDYVEVQECRTLSKIVHFVLIKKIRSKQIKEIK